ncbi:3 5 -cyclic nucleotide phosphodiesterase domain-containing protein [Cystoisospora suis]|uniref:3 5-cyclic nucleotide phosphodiesterase domain-containing protein n=1 Tax=Cystoisospora suis TaxID=483139 RepID=A0A2C6KDN7_9APIC|nr:3 5 -cyclic nucleotide phosphodiesterase domain-containing protein [Cystoisospora suis]
MKKTEDDKAMMKITSPPTLTPLEIAVDEKKSEKILKEQQTHPPSSNRNDHTRKGNNTRHVLTEPPPSAQPSLRHTALSATHIKTLDERKARRHPSRHHLHLLQGEKSAQEKKGLFLPKPRECQKEEARRKWSSRSRNNPPSRSRSSNSSSGSDSESKSTPTSFIMTTSITTPAKQERKAKNTSSLKRKLTQHKSFMKHQTCWRRRPLRQLLRVILPVPLRFENDKHEEKFAAFIQRQMQRNIWWSVFIPIFSLCLECCMTALTTPDFSPLHHTPQLLYTVGTGTVVSTFLFLSFISRFSQALPYLEACLCVSGCLYSLFLPVLCDHYRIAALLGFSPQEIWGRESFSDGPVLLALTALMFSVAIFIPVRDTCLWPVCLAAVSSFQSATLLTGGADGLRPSIINGLLLMLLAYLALIGRLSHTLTDSHSPAFS